MMILPMSIHVCAACVRRSRTGDGRQDESSGIEGNAIFFVEPLVTGGSFLVALRRTDVSLRSRWYHSGSSNSAASGRARGWTGCLLFFVFLMAILGSGLLAPSLAQADKPFRMGAQIEDRAGALEGREADIRRALDDLAGRVQVQLWLAYVDSFSGVGAKKWAEQTAIESDLGMNDALIAVAVQDRAYAYSVDQDFPLSDAELTEVMSVAVEPALVKNDWAGAAIAATTGLTQALRGQTVTTPYVQPGEPAGGGDSGGGFPVGAIVGLIVLVTIIVTVWILVRRSRRSGSQRAVPQAAAQGGPAAQPAASLAELRRQASAALVETDDAVKSSANEVGFAAAQFGEEQAAPFQKALEEARRELDQAFALHRQVDATDNEQQQRQMLTALLQHTSRANETLDAQSDRFDKLRDLEKNASKVLAATDQKLNRLEARVPQVREELARLAGVYSPAALGSVGDNADEAAERIAFAREQVQAGQEDVAAGLGGEAAITSLAAQEAAAQAQALLDAVGRLGQDLSEARSRTDAAIAETQRDIAEARAAQEAASLAPLVATAEAAVNAAIAAASPMGGHDPLAALRHLEEADAALEKALQGVRENQAQLAKATVALERTLMAARAEAAAADDYIITHRGAVGSGPRTLLAQAQRDLHKATATAVSDPVTAVRHAANAHELAGRALSDAQEEVRRAASGGMGGFPGMGGSDGSGEGFGGALAGAIIGGILSGALGGRSSRSGDSFGGGGFAPPSFGGSGTRMRRGGGGRF